MVEPLFQVRAEKETNKEGVFVIEPLVRGYGQTLGNSLRRVLLSSIRGAAVTWVKIAGIRHRFATMEGLREDMVDLLLNIKKIRLSYKGDKPEKITLDKTGPGEVKAGDIVVPPMVKIINPELVLGSLASKKNRLKVEMTVESGFGYSLGEEREAELLGDIPLDAVFSPVLEVSYKVEATRVGRRTDFDRLVLVIKTDGSVAPAAVVKESAVILVEMFNQIINPKKLPKKEKETKGEDVSREVLSLTVEELSLPTRIANALRKGGYKTVADLVAIDLSELVKVKNLGEKSVRTVNAALVEKGIDFEKIKKSRA